MRCLNCNRETNTQVCPWCGYVMPSKNYGTPSGAGNAYGPSGQGNAYGQSGRGNAYGQNGQGVRGGRPTYNTGYTPSGPQQSYGQYQGRQGVYGGQNTPGYSRPVQQTSASAQAAQKKSAAQSRKRTWITFGAIWGALLIIFGMLFIFGVFGKKTKSDDTDSTETGTTTEEGGSQQKVELESEEIYQKASKSTVEVRAKNAAYESVGTGFFDDDHGTIITNYHVIDGMTEASIVTSDNMTYQVTGVVGYDTDMDIALLETGATSSVPMEKSQDKAKTGEKIYALGSSKGYAGTFSEGIVSTAERKDKGHVYIQHTAPITNGNSGGPLLNKYGQVIGINNWVRTDGQNLNFAIPIDQVENVKRGTAITLASVYSTEYGSSYDPNGYSSIMGSGGPMELSSYKGKSLMITAPEGTQRKNSNGTTFALYQEGENLVAISGQIKDKTYIGSLDQYSDEMMKTITDELDKLKASYGFEYKQLESQKLQVNGVYWNSFTTTGTVSDSTKGTRFVQVAVLCCEKDDVVGMVEVMCILGNEQDKGKEMINVEAAIIGSLKLQ